MSKSDDSPQGTVLVLDGPRRSRRRSSRRSPTRAPRSATTARRSPASRTSSRSTRAVTGRTIADVEQEFAGRQYGAFKAAVADAVVECLRPVQEAYAEARSRSRRGRPPARARRRQGPRHRRARARPRPRRRRPASTTPLGAALRVVGGLQGFGDRDRHAARRPAAAVMVGRRPNALTRRARRRPGSGRRPGRRGRGTTPPAAEAGRLRPPVDTGGSGDGAHEGRDGAPDHPRPASSLPTSWNSAAASQRGRPAFGAGQARARRPSRPGSCTAGRGSGASATTRARRARGCRKPTPRPGSAVAARKGTDETASEVASTLHRTMKSSSPSMDGVNRRPNRSVDNPSRNSTRIRTGGTCTSRQPIAWQHPLDERRAVERRDRQQVEQPEEEVHDREEEQDLDDERQVRDRGTRAGLASIQRPGRHRRDHHQREVRERAGEPDEEHVAARVAQLRLGFTGTGFAHASTREAGDRAPARAG